MILNHPTTSFHTKSALLLCFGMCAVIATVLGFEHIGGYIPCKLCLGQREPYYAAIPVAVLATLSAWRSFAPCLTRGALLIIGLLMIYAALLGIHHAGVEWKFWEGPSDCASTSGGLTTNAGDLLGDLVDKKIPSCGEAAGRFLGLSFAGWNVIAAIALALIAFRAAFSHKN